jgi:hypothetical protein
MSEPQERRERREQSDQVENALRLLLANPEGCPEDARRVLIDTDAATIQRTVLRLLG